MIKKYVKNPVVVEAMKWTGHNVDELYSFIGVKRADFSTKTIDEDNGELCVKTTEGSIYVPVNHFIIKVNEGEFYTCNPDEFHDTYTDISGRDVYFSIEAKL